MKKVYMTPEMEITEIETQTLMLGLSKVDDEFDTNEEENLAGDRRGTWGNLWN